MKSVRVNPDIDWKSIELEVGNHEVCLWMNIKGNEEDYDFRLNLDNHPAYIYDLNSKYASPVFPDSLLLVLLLGWELHSTIVVTETIYGKNSGVIADYQNDGTYLSEDGDVWEIKELVSWES